MRFVLFVLLCSVPFFCFAQIPCLEFDSGPFVNIQTPPCDLDCGTPIETGFEVFENESYNLNATAGSEYIIDFCSGYNSDDWEAVITVGVADPSGGIIPASQIATSVGCRLIFSTPNSGLYLIVISGQGNCGGDVNSTANGLLTLDCGPNGVICDGPPVPCYSFASGPFVNIQSPPCDIDCGTPIETGFGVFENEAYNLNATAGSEYTIDFCEGYDASVWPAFITVGFPDGMGGLIPNTIVAAEAGCQLTFTVPFSGTYVIVISGENSCGDPVNSTENGLLTLDCGPSGVACDGPPPPCLEFASGPFVNIQTPPCDLTCGTPVETGFGVFENEAYNLNAIEGSEYIIDFCEGYDPANWPAVITVGLSNGSGGIQAGTQIAAGGGCSLTFTTPTTDLYVIVISGEGTCGDPVNQTGNGLLTLDCGPNGATCLPPAAPCLEFSFGPFVNIQNPPCDDDCGTPVSTGFEVFENEAYLFNGIGGSEYTIDFCTDYNESNWAAVITVGLYDGTDAVFGSEVAFIGDCSLTFTAPFDTTYLVVISGRGNCGGSNNQTENGFLEVDCGPGGATCDPITSVESPEFEGLNPRLLENPSTSGAQIRFNSNPSSLLSVSAQVSVINMQGQAIYSKIWTSGINKQLALPVFPEGVYIIQLKIGDQQKAFKFIQINP